MTMSVITPTALTDAMLVSSTVAETDYTAWNAATSYVVGDRVMRAVSGVHKNFENLIAGIDAGLPEASPTRWLDLGATNRWKMFDDKVGTVTVVASPLTIVVNPGRVSGVALLELVGKQATITLKDGPGGAVVYSATKELDGTVITSWYEWFFEDYEQLTDWAVTALPAHYTAPELTISITATSGNVECGVCKFGLVAALGGARFGARVGIVDYSRKEIDDFGNVSVTQRSFSKRNTLKLITEKAQFNRIFRTLANLRAIPAIYIATEEAGYEPLMVYGFYRDFSIDVAYPTRHLCNLEIEGLI